MLFLVHALDRPDSAALRAEVRPAHAAYHARRNNPLGGPLRSPDGDTVGSCYIVEAPDLEAAWDVANADPYAAAGLFERIEVHEFVPLDWTGPPDATA